MRVHPWLLSSSAVALSLVFFLGAAGDANAQRYVDSRRCSAAVEQELARLGLSMQQLTQARWVVDETVSQGSRNVWGYWFMGRPPSCSSGDIRIDMSATCGVRSVRARGGCSVPGL